MVDLFAEISQRFPARPAAAIGPYDELQGGGTLPNARSILCPLS